MTHSAKPTRLLARSLFDGSGAAPQTDMVVEATEGRITKIAPFRQGDALDGLDEHDILMPGLIDIQINGANDVQFNDTPTAQALAQMAQGAERGGTAWILPTFVTARNRDYLQAIHAVCDAIESEVSGILGLHLEGPFLSPRRPGIHDSTAIRRIDEEDIKNLIRPFPGPLMLTVAPEEMPPETLAQLTKAGVIVFAGHSEASHAEMISARAQGLSGATHLFNAMSQMSVREPGVVGTVLGTEGLYAGIIADGHHVHWNNLALAASLMPDRLCLVTDAMCTLAGTRSGFEMPKEKIFLVDGRLFNMDGTLAGAHLSMDQSIRNVIDRGIAMPSQAVRMATSNPAGAIGVAGELGCLRIGSRACFTTMDENWNATGVIR